MFLWLWLMIMALLRLFIIFFQGRAVLREGRAVLWASHAFVYFACDFFCSVSLPLGVMGWLWFVIVSLPCPVDIYYLWYHNHCYQSSWLKSLFLIAYNSQNTQWFIYSLVLLSFSWNSLSPMTKSQVPNIFLEQFSAIFCESRGTQVYKICES